MRIQTSTALYFVLMAAVIVAVDVLFVAPTSRPPHSRQTDQTGFIPDLVEAARSPAA